MGYRRLCSNLHALPLAFENRLSEPCDRPDVTLRLCLQRLLNAQPRDCRFNRLVETLVICIDRIDEQLDLRLGEDDSLEFLEHRRIGIERPAAVIPLVLPLGFHDQCSTYKCDELSE